MTEKASADLRVRNVTLHQRGSKATGTLTLTAHHVLFRYTPEEIAPGSGPQRLSQSQLRAASHATPTNSTQSSTVSEAASADGGTAPSSTTSGISKSAVKSIYVAYPMINRCILRPSHTQSSYPRSTPHSGDSNGFEEADDGFPPSYGTGYGRPSTDSAHLAPYSSPRQAASPAAGAADGTLVQSTGRSPAIRLRCRDFRMMALHFESSSGSKSADEVASEVFFKLRSHCCVGSVQDMYAYQFVPPPEERAIDLPAYDARREFARMGIGGKVAEGPGSAWRITDINDHYEYSATYPSVLCVPRAVSDNMLKYGGAFRSKARIPALAYLHFNGGSITRSSQPLVGVQNKRNPQDERLVSAIFSSHTPPLPSPADSPPQMPSLTSPSTTTLDSSSSDPVTLDSDIGGLPSSHSEAALDGKAIENITPVKPKVYGSTRRNYIVDARPKINVIANRAGGGGIEDVSNYTTSGDVPIEKVYLNIQNIHAMRTSLERVIESFGNADYTSLAPDQEMLRRSCWLTHIAGLLEGADLVARAVGLTGSHTLVHCSDGWDRTSQVSALAQIMLDPHYRTLNGFITLVQKDFLSFGHKFRDRNGMLGSEKWFEMENQRIIPSRVHKAAGLESSGLNNLGSKALAGAKNWFEKNRSNLFRQQNDSQEDLADASSRPASPPPNSLLHSPPSAGRKADGERRIDEKEIAPIFHQFLDAVYQLLRQYPHAFEFNERFLLRLLYQVYAGQYGEFLFNNEKERLQLMGKAHSVWPFFLARRNEFTNPGYTAKYSESLLLPKRGTDQQVDVRWWSKLFARQDKDMNVPLALAPADPPSLTIQPSSLSLDDRAVSSAEQSGTPSSEDMPRGSKSTLSLTKQSEDLSAEVSKSNMQPAAMPGQAAQQPPLQAKESGFEVLARYTASSPSLTAANASADIGRQHQAKAEGDPLGVAGSSGHSQGVSDRLDFAGFASASAFQDRR